MLMLTQPAPKSSHARKSKRPVIREHARTLAFAFLRNHPQGLRYSELHRKICQADPHLNSNTVNTSIWNLDTEFPDLVYKPVKGLFRLVAFQDDEASERVDPELSICSATEPIREEVFYPLFASWLKNELEEVTQAIPLGGNFFRSRWGTPDVIGISESRRSDVIKGPLSIVSAEIKSDPSSLITGFGQGCVYKLFSHKSYLAVTKDVSADELARLDSLCHIHGSGLVTFNAKDPLTPDFRLLVRPSRHEPDLFYANRYLSHVEKDLFQ